MSETLKKENGIRDHMINVISSLHSNYNIDDLMPLINLLKMFNNKVAANDIVEGKMNNTLIGSADLDLNEKINYFVKRINVENSMQDGMNRALILYMKTNSNKDYINKLRYEILSSFEIRKLFIVALKQILLENNTEASSSNLEWKTMGLIKAKCVNCSKNFGTQEKNAIDQFCICRMDTFDVQPLKAVSGSLEITVLGFIGHYNSLDIDNIFKGISLPCDKRLTWTQKCQCSGLPKESSLMKTKHDRMVAILIDNKIMATSKWSNTKIKGLVREEIFFTRAKEFELQVWENRKEKGMKAKHRYLIAVVSMPLASFLKCSQTTKLTYNLDPTGMIFCEIRLTPMKMFKDAVVAPCIIEHKIKRSFSIKRRINHYRKAHNFEQNAQVAAWEQIFVNNMKKLVITTVNNNVSTAPTHESTFRSHSDKCDITTSKNQTTEQKIITQERYINMSPSIYNTKLNHINPRTICPFYKANSEAQFFCQKNTIEPKYSSSVFNESIQTSKLEDALGVKIKAKSIFCQNNTIQSRYSSSIFNESIQTSKLEDAVSVKIKAKPVYATPLSSRITNTNIFCTSTPIVDSTDSSFIQNTNSTMNINRVSYRFMKGSTTRSNLELSLIDDVESQVMNLVHSDDEEAKNELQYNGQIEEELNIIRIPKVMYSNDGSDLIPMSCTPEQMKIPMFKIDSETKSNVDWSVLYTPIKSKSEYRSSNKAELNMSLNESISTSDVNESVDQKYYNDDDYVNVKGIDDYVSNKVKVNGIHEFLDEKHNNVDAVNDSMNDESCEMGDKMNVNSIDDSVDEESLVMAAKRNIGGSQVYRGRKLCLDDLELLSVLGHGRFGKVLLARYQKEPRVGGICAIKVIQKSDSSSELEYESVRSEREILMRITHRRSPFLVGLIGCFQTERHLILAIEYACGGDLMGHIHRGSFSEETSCFYGACVVLALGFLHSENIAYRDIKLDNLLLDRYGYVKLTDFGLSKQNMNWDTKTTTFCGTPEFLAPEIVNDQPYSRDIDWWAFGVLMFEMILGETPFPGNEDYEIYEGILKNQSLCHDDLSTEALSLIQRLLRHLPQSRLGYGVRGTEKVKSHIFFKHVNWLAMAARTVPPPLVPKLDNPVDTQYFEEDFTNRVVTIEHENTSRTKLIDDDLFRDFDTSINWDKFVDLSCQNL